MKILFANGAHVDIVLSSLPITNTILPIFKHLQHVTLPFRDWDNPYYSKSLTHDQLVEALQKFGKCVDVDVDPQRCDDQNYLNKLHQIYEAGYDGRSSWLDFHEHIHLCEAEKPCADLYVLSLDYRELSGPLEKKFDLTWLEHCSNTVKAGDVYIEWAELGKSPYSYWLSQEPNHINRLCELAKPWLKLRPKLRVSLQDHDLLGGIDAMGFQGWWAQYHDAWCQHWNVPSWTLQQMYTAAVFGNIPNLDIMIDLLKNRINPVKVML